ncbi:MAG: tRNA epoxyqueuosine(34) reductase QueG [Ignavibacteria bacterium]|nr:tRNA epoxyqueuosine(34) reductase QueG [Ignavibacteria bacterium]
MTLTEKIKKLCILNDFNKTGISAPVLPEKDILQFEHWMKEGGYSDMYWFEMQKEKRINPSLILPDVKSIISLAYVYDTPFEYNDNIPKISRYAWGKIDYHKFLKKKLKKLCGNIKSELKNDFPDIKLFYFVDDGPVAEKSFAVKSGIGWQGKNTLVINPEFGTFFFLCEILTNIELEPDAPMEDLCGSCSICSEACPTGALNDEYKLNINLCISYHNIENKNKIPDKINLNGWIYGCDICQNVCPYNKHKYFTSEQDFHPLPELFNKPLSTYTSITENEFNTLFSTSPVKRLKYSNFKRNLSKL